MEEEKLNLLIEALEEYKNKWEFHKQTYNIRKDKTHIDEKLIVKYTSMIYLAQWIINSINGGLDKPHATNICNILREDS